MFFHDVIREEFNEFLFINKSTVVDLVKSICVGSVEMELIGDYSKL